jgi:hypothetical protein
MDGVALIEMGRHGKRREREAVRQMRNWHGDVQ